VQLKASSKILRMERKYHGRFPPSPSLTHIPKECDVVRVRVRVRVKVRVRVWVRGQI
jgi:hypothetical protein